jgi:hypothetical protein
MSSAVTAYFLVRWGIEAEALQDCSIGRSGRTVGDKASPRAVAVEILSFIDGEVK